MIFAIDDKVYCEEKSHYLETAGSTGWAIRQHILDEYPGDILGFIGAAVVQINLKREIDHRLLNVLLNGAQSTQHRDWSIHTD